VDVRGGRACLAMPDVAHALPARSRAGIESEAASRAPALQKIGAAATIIGVLQRPTFGSWDNPRQRVMGPFSKTVTFLWASQFTLGT
jgi:hypothetical protein